MADFHYTESIGSLLRVLTQALEHGISPDSAVKVCVSNKQEAEEADRVGEVWSAVYDGKNVYITASDESEWE